MAKTLSREEAEEYTKNLGSVTVGNWGLMEMARDTLKVPDALGLTFDEWVQDRLGGFVRRSVEQRREAVRELSGEKTGEGKQARYVRSAKDVAEILGVGEATVKEDRTVLEAMASTAPATNRLEIAETSTAPASEPKKMTPDEKKVEIRRRIDLGESDAEIDLALGIAISSVAKARRAYKKELETTAAPPRSSTPSSSKPSSRPSASTDEATALARLDGYLATIEGHALGLAAWWLQEGKEALAEKLAWADETISHTEEKVVGILHSVRGIDADADTALAAWLAEAGR